MGYSDQALTLNNPGHVEGIPSSILCTRQILIRELLAPFSKRSSSGFAKQKPFRCHHFLKRVRA